MTAEVRGKGIAEKGDIPGVKNVIAVGSGKGGVGKSTMAAAIAYGLQSYGSTVGLMDADVYGPSIPHLVGATGRPMARGERIQPIEANGLKLMSMGFLLEPERAVIMRGPMLHGIMQQFLHQVDWGQLDYLVIDLPPGTGDVPLTLAQSLPADRGRGRLHAAGGRPARRRPRRRDVPPAQGPHARDDREHELLRRPGLPQGPRRPEGPAARREQGFFDAPGDERVYLFGRGGARRKAEQMGVPFLGEVPLNIHLRETRRRGQDGAVAPARLSGTALLIGTAAALVGGGMALAADDNGSGRQGSGGSSGSAQSLPGPPPLPPPDKNLTYAEIHVQRDGEAQVIRTDAGEVASTSADSITVSENDGNDVTIPIDDETKFATGPGEEGDVSDPAEGDRILVTGSKGEAADIVFVPPTRAELRREFKGHGLRRGRLMPPPAGAPGAGMAIPLPPPQGGR